MQDKRDRPDASKSLVGFTVGAVSYAVPIGSVREIVNPTDLTELPRLPESVAGVADHRGEVIPVVDLRRRFGVASSGGRTREKWILVDVSGRTVGLIVDQVTEVFGTYGEGVRAAPQLGSGDDVRGIGGVISHGGKLTFVLDVSRFEQVTAAIPESALLDAMALSQAPEGPP